MKRWESYVCDQLDDIKLWGGGEESSLGQNNMAIFPSNGKIPPVETKIQSQVFLCIRRDLKHSGSGVTRTGFGNHRSRQPNHALSSAWWGKRISFRLSFIRSITIGLCWLYLCDWNTWINISMQNSYTQTLNKCWIILTAENPQITFPLSSNRF